jgi:hypothetical protein
VLRGARNGRVTPAVFHLDKLETDGLLEVEYAGGRCCVVVDAAPS